MIVFPCRFRDRFPYRLYKKKGHAKIRKKPTKKILKSFFIILNGKKECNTVSDVAWCRFESNYSFTRIMLSMESRVFESPKHFENVQVLSLEQTTFHPCAARALIFFSASLGLTCKRVYCMIFPPLIVFSTFYHEKNILSIQFVKFIDFFLTTWP